MDGGPQRERRSDDRGRRSVRRLRCLDWSGRRHVNSYLAFLIRFRARAIRFQRERPTLFYTTAGRLSLGQ